jgi:hypothetical protein
MTSLELKKKTEEMCFKVFSSKKTGMKARYHEAVRKIQQQQSKARTP